MRRFLRDTRGATAVEYALVVTVIGAALVASSESLSRAVVDKFACVAQTIGIGTGMC